MEAHNKSYIERKLIDNQTQITSSSSNKKSLKWLNLGITTIAVPIFLGAKILTQEAPLGLMKLMTGVALSPMHLIQLLIGQKVSHKNYSLVAAALHVVRIVAFAATALSSPVLGIKDFAMDTQSTLNLLTSALNLASEYAEANWIEYPDVKKPENNSDPRLTGRQHIFAENDGNGAGVNSHDHGAEISPSQGELTNTEAAVANNLSRKEEEHDVQSTQLINPKNSGKIQDVSKNQTVNKIKKSMSLGDLSPLNDNAPPESTIKDTNQFVYLNKSTTKSNSAPLKAEENFTEQTQPPTSEVQENDKGVSNNQNKDKQIERKIEKEKRKQEANLNREKNLLKRANAIAREVDIAKSNVKAREEAQSSVPVPSTILTDDKTNIKLVINNAEDEKELEEAIANELAKASQVQVPEKKPSVIQTEASKTNKKIEENLLRRANQKNKEVIEKCSKLDSEIEAIKNSGLASKTAKDVKENLDKLTNINHQILNLKGEAKEKVDENNSRAKSSSTPENVKNLDQATLDRATVSKSLADKVEKDLKQLLKSKSKEEKITKKSESELKMKENNESPAKAQMFKGESVKLEEFSESSKLEETVIEEIDINPVVALSGDSNKIAQAPEDKVVEEIKSEDKFIKSQESFLPSIAKLFNKEEEVGAIKNSRKQKEAIEALKQKNILAQKLAAQKLRDNAKLKAKQVQTQDISKEDMELTKAEEQLLSVAKEKPAVIKIIDPSELEAAKKREEEKLKTQQEQLHAQIINENLLPTKRFEAKINQSLAKAVKNYNAIEKNPKSLEKIIEDLELLQKEVKNFNKKKNTITQKSNTAIKINKKELEKLLSIINNEVDKTSDNLNKKIGILIENLSEEKKNLSNITALEDAKATIENAPIESQQQRNNKYQFNVDWISLFGRVQRVLTNNS